MNLHARGQALLNRVNASPELGGASVLYSRQTGGVTTTLPLTGAVGREQPDGVTTPTPNARLSDRERDYLFAFADLVAAGFNAPAEGDRIAEVLNGTAETFEVVRRDREPCWRWADFERTRVRVHTTRVG